MLEAIGTAQIMDVLYDLWFSDIRDKNNLLSYMLNPSPYIWVLICGTACIVPSDKYQNAITTVEKKCHEWFTFALLWYKIWNWEKRKCITILRMLTLCHLLKNQVLCYPQLSYSFWVKLKVAPHAVIVISSVQYKDNHR